MTGRLRGGALAVVCIATVVAVHWLTRTEDKPVKARTCVEENAGYMVAQLLKEPVRHQRELAVRGDLAIVWALVDLAPTCVALKFTDCDPDSWKSGSGPHPHQNKATVLFTEKCSAHPEDGDFELAALKKRAGWPQEH